MKRILLFIPLIASLSFGSTFIGNGGQTGDVELAVSLRQVRGAVEHIQTLAKENPQQRFCICPIQYADHSLCEMIKKLNIDQQKYCEQFIVSQLSKLNTAANATQFEWVETKSMVNSNKVGERVVDAVARKDKKMIYIDQKRFISIADTHRLFLLTHELYHMDNFDGRKLDDEDPIGPFTQEYGVRDLLNAAAAGVVLTSLDQSVFQSYSKYLKQSRSSNHHWVGLTWGRSAVEDSKKTNFDTQLSSSARFTYHYHPDFSYNFGLTLHMETSRATRALFSSTKITETRSVSAIGLSYRYFLMNHLDPFNHFWSTFLQFEILAEGMRGLVDLSDPYTSQESKATSNSAAARVSIYVPIKYDFWLNAGLDFSQHELYYQELDYKLVSKTPNFFFGVTYGF